MDAATVVRQLWTRTQARDWAGVGELVAEDAIIEWPVSAERIVGRANYVAVNSTYPEGWEIRVLRIIGSGDEAVSEVEVPHETMGVFRAVSLWTVKDGQIVRGTEYWTSPGSDPAQPGRAAYVERE
jgi:ketosteroid isomerase-like protein